jgi:hypothetical protein
MLKTMMEHQVDDHNEVVLDATAWVRGLPATIEAFFVAADTGDRDRVRQVAEDYRRQYGLSEEEVPIVMYDPALPRPFSKITL